MNFGITKLDFQQAWWVGQQLKDYDICFIGIHGSKLYGLDHEGSDTDIKAVYLPSKTDLILGEAIKTVSKKNDELNIEIEIKSLSSFLKSAKSCDTNCVDILHTPENMILYKTDLWDTIVQHKQGLYAKNMKGLVGYVKTHVHKYSNKIERLKEIQWVKDSINSTFLDQDTETIAQFCEHFNDQINSLKFVNVVTTVQDHEQQYLEVCGKKYIFTWNLSQLLSAMNKEISRYGKRTNGGIDSGLDSKALSHSLRVLCQMKEMIETGNIQFPLKDVDYIKKVKMGEITNVDEVISKIDNLYEEVMILLEEGDLPDEVDLSGIYEVVEEFYFGY